MEGDEQEIALDLSEDPILDPNEVAEMLHRLLKKLPPRDRLVLTLRYLQQNSIFETAELTGWTVAMVKVQTWRAKNKFKKLYEEL